MVPPSASRAALVAICVGAWVGAVNGEFQFDDWWLVVRDEATSEWPALAARLGHGVRPLLRLSYFLDHALWGMSPFAFHATNLLLHVAAVLLAYGLARRRLGSGAAAFLASAVFALQPANAEVVAYVSGRSTGLMATLLLAGLLAHDQARDLAGGARALRQGLALLLFCAACFAKEVALAFPLLVVFWDVTGPAQEPSRCRATAWLGAALVAALAAGLLASSPRYRWLASYSAAIRTPGESALVNARAVPEMLSLWTRPWALSVDHAFDAGPHLAASALGAVFLMGLAAVAWGARRRAPLLTLAVGWAFVALAPTNSVVAKLDLVTEKPLYLAWFGPSLLFGAIGGRLLERSRSGWPRRAVVAGLAALLTGAGISCMVRAATWRDARLLWGDAVVKAPSDSRAWNNLGMAYFQKNQYRDARAAFEKALRLDPDNTTARLNVVVLDTLHGSAGRRTR